jgi:hypothetical protein
MALSGDAICHRALFSACEVVRSRKAKFQGAIFRLPIREKEADKIDDDVVSGLQRP